MQKKIVILVVIISAVLLVGVTAFSVGNTYEEKDMTEVVVDGEKDMADFSVNMFEEAGIETFSEICQSAAMYAAFDALVARGEHLDSIEIEYLHSNRTFGEGTNIDASRRELTHEWASFFANYGWELYDAFMYDGIANVIESTEMSILIIGDIIYWVQSGKMPVLSIEEKEALLALYEDRLSLEQEFLLRLESYLESYHRFGIPYDIRALSGEREFLYFLSESQFELGARLQEVIDNHAASQHD